MLAKQGVRACVAGVEKVLKEGGKLRKSLQCSKAALGLDGAILICGQRMHEDLGEVGMHGRAALDGNPGHNIKREVWCNPPWLWRCCIPHRYTKLPDGIGADEWQDSWPVDDALHQ